MQPTDVVPHFSKALTPSTVSCGDQIRLDVVVFGAPKPKLYWFNEKKKIRESRHVRLVEKETPVEDSNQVQIESSLQIDTAHEFDSGKYTVRAINRSGVKSTSVNLVVKGDYCHYLNLLLAYLQAFDRHFSKPKAIVIH